MSRSGPVSVEVARDLDALPEVMDLVETFFTTTDADPKVRYPVELAIEELFTNVVKYNSYGKSDIRIEIEIDGGEVVVTLTDFDAPKWDPLSDAPGVETFQPLARRKPGGLGIYLVKKMMDSIEYSHQDRTGTITLHKRMN